MRTISIFAFLIASASLAVAAPLSDADCEAVWKLADVDQNEDAFPEDADQIDRKEGAVDDLGQPRGDGERAQPDHAAHQHRNDQQEKDETGSMHSCASQVYSRVTGRL